MKVFCAFEKVELELLNSTLTPTNMIYTFSVRWDLMDMLFVYNQPSLGAYLSSGEESEGANTACQHLLFVVNNVWTEKW